MTDLEQLKNAIDLRAWVERDLGQAPVYRGTGDRAWCFKCPFHQERKGASLVVYKTFWKCYGACSESGDALAWVAKRQGLYLNERQDFMKAVLILGGDPGHLPAPAASRGSTPKPPLALTPALPPSPAWQAVAFAVAERARQYLWSRGGRKALDYLLQQRGLHEQTIQEARLGYIPASSGRWRFEEGLLIPTHCITIPWFADDMLWGVKCRRLAGDEPRYLQFAVTRSHQAVLGKSNLDGSLYWVDKLVQRSPVIIVEGEFNCLALWEAAHGRVYPVSLGTSGQALNVRWFASLVTAPVILAWFDADRAGQEGARRLAGLARYIQPLKLPDGVGKDLNDFWRDSQRRGDPDAVWRWLCQSLK